MSDVILTARLDLVPMTPQFLRETMGEARAAAEALLGARIPADWFRCADFAARRLRQFDAGATSQPWLPRAMRWRETGEMVGYIGFHTPPRPAYLQAISPAGVEFGYTVFPAYRRRGFALEAARGLIGWAQRTQGVRNFVVSVSPGNAASLGLIAQLGFRRVGSQIDEEDGPEDIFELVREETAG